MLLTNLKAQCLCVIFVLLISGSLPDNSQARDIRDEAGVTLTGTIKRLDGITKPSLVSVKNLTRGITWTLLSSETGRFRFDGMPSGEYSLWVRSTGLPEYTSTIGNVEDAHHAEVILAAGEARALLTNAEMLAQMPVNSQAGQLLRYHCIQCHGLEFIVPHHRTSEEWTNTVDQMAALVPPAPAGEMEQIAGYLGRHLGRENRTNISMLGERSYSFHPQAVMVQLDLPVPTAKPHEMVFGPDQKLWVSDFDVRANAHHNNLFRIDPDTLNIETLMLSEPSGGARSIAFDTQGRAWITILFGNKLVRMDPGTGQTHTINLGENKIWPHSLAFDKQGYAWVTGMKQDILARVNPEDAGIERHAVPTPRSMLYDIEIDEQDRVWYTGLFAHKLGMFDPGTGQFAEYPTLTPLSSTRYMTFGPDGDIWIALFAAGKIARFDPEKKTFREYSLPDPNSSPYDLLVTAEGIIWFTDFTRNSLTRFHPESGEVDEFSIPGYPYARPNEIAMDNRGRIWFCENGSAKVTYVDPAGLAEPGGYLFSKKR